MRVEVDLSEIDREVPAARERFEALEDLRETMSKRLEDARATQRKYALLKTKPRVFAAGDMVWLAGRHIHSIRPCKKLDYKYYGPFKILEAVGPQAYRLDITGHLHGIHPVFHVSLLEPARRREGEELPQPSIEVIDGIEETEVKSILDSKVSNRTLYYLVEWVGHSEAHNEWLPASELIHAPDVVADYHRTHPTAAGERELEQSRKDGAPRPRGRPPAQPVPKSTKRGRPKGTTVAPPSTRRSKPASATSRPRGRPRKHKDTSQPTQTAEDTTQGPRWDKVTTEYLRHVTRGLRQEGTEGTSQGEQSNFDSTTLS
jgi:hypothetical protein